MYRFCSIKCFAFTFANYKKFLVDRNSLNYLKLTYKKYNVIYTYTHITCIIYYIQRVLFNCVIITLTDDYVL